MNRRVVISLAIGVGAVAVAITVSAAVRSDPSHASPRQATAVRAIRPAARTTETTRAARTSLSGHRAPSMTSTTRTTGPDSDLVAPRHSPPVAFPAGLPPTISRVPTTDNVIFLGIDDGIWRDPSVLTKLTEARIPFTMFLVRPEAQAGIPYFQTLQTVGGTVESHTTHHPDLTKLTYWGQHEEICSTTTDYQQWFGRRPTLFRPPYGKWNQLTRQAAAACGYKALILWEGATNDGRLDVIGGRLRPGDILLMHFRPDLAENLELVFATARAQGFEIARLEDYVGGG